MIFAYKIDISLYKDIYMKIVMWFLWLCLALLGIGRWLNQEKATQPDRTDELTQQNNKTTQTTNMEILPLPTEDSAKIIVSEPVVEKVKAPIPPSIQLDVPFYVQAPDNKRVLPRTETCEEASLVLVAYYIKWLSLTKEQFKQEMLALIEVEKKLFNNYIDNNIAELEKVYQSYYNNGTTKIIDNPTISQIKEELAKGNIIVAPFAGRELKNPHFSGSGPRYHMLVIRWYDDLYFYTNDVGTLHGENFAYTHDIIINAMHDLTDGDISQWAKRMLVIAK